MLLLWIAIGALVGGGGALLAQAGPWWAAAVVHYAAPYALLIALIGVLAPGPRAAALRAACCFTAFVLLYYVVVAVRFGSVPVLYAAAWLVAALSVCPAGAACAAWSARRKGVLPAAVFALAGAAALSDGSVGNLVRMSVGRLDPSFLSPALVVTGCVDLVAALVVTAVLPRRPRTRVLAVALLVPFGVAATFIGWTAHFGLGPYLPRSL